jgi:hypothetical protein
MSKLIQALQIFLKYGDPSHPTHCEHDLLSIMIDPNIVSDEDKKSLEQLGFYEASDGENFISHKYGCA